MFKYLYLKNIPYKNFIPYPTPNIPKKLMVFFAKKKKIKHDTLNNLHKYFNKNDIIIRNNSKAYPTKYICFKNNSNSKIIIYLLRELNPIHHIWDTIVYPARKIRIGNKIYFKNKKKIILKSIIINNTTSRGRILKFIFKKNNIKLKKKLFKLGKILLFNNIKKKKKK
ncbi:MAG: S-adenosylmethionine:tRNA ribosyltransferase-isomerase [Candidatus Shikimatogenerans bostrichidophilus]|nr:MAG: S-adenosylmethionine:tRNA ribosyltransferase-isomerase [Candidatus Shikimatogenerans bostrichidophilus]